MSNKTIKELADELHITKQTIQYHIKFLPTKNRQKNSSGVTVLTESEVDFIKERIKKRPDKRNTENRQRIDKENELLFQQIQDLKEQNFDLRRLLDQQQQLQLKTQEMLEEKTLLLETEKSKRWWKFWS